MTRRDFLKTSGLTVLGTTFLGGMLTKLFAAPKTPLVAPIKDSRMYNAIGRKLMLVEELPQGALARYERDIAAKSYVIGKRIPGKLIQI